MNMLSVMVAGMLAVAAQDPGQWQDFGGAPGGESVSLNLDSIETGVEGPEAGVRGRCARAGAGRAAGRRACKPEPATSIRAKPAVKAPGRWCVCVMRARPPMAR